MEKFFTERPRRGPRLMDSRAARRAYVWKCGWRVAWQSDGYASDTSHGRLVFCGQRSGQRNDQGHVKIVRARPRARKIGVQSAWPREGPGTRPCGSRPYGALSQDQRPNSASRRSCFWVVGWSIIQVCSGKEALRRKVAVHVDNNATHGSAKGCGSAGHCGLMG